jgi:hypothetical protein
VQVNLRYSLDLRPYQKLLIPLCIALVNQPGPCPSNYEEGQELSLLSTSQKYGFFFVTQAKRNTKTTYVASASPAYERIAQPAAESFSPRDQAKWERNTMPEQRQ